MSRDKLSSDDRYKLSCQRNKTYFVTRLSVFRVRKDGNRAQTESNSSLPPTVKYQLPISHFYPRNAMHSSVFATATCLSACPSHAGIVPHRAIARSWNVHCLIAPWF